MRQIILLCFSALLLVTGCSIISSGIKEQSVLVDTKVLTGKNIALLNFEKEGNGLPNNVEKSVPDKLAQLIFAFAKMTIVDRSLVNNTQIGIKHNGNLNLSRETIKQLGMALNADFVILGKVSNSQTNMEFIEGPEGTVSVSVRILSVENAKVIGMVSFAVDYNNDLQKKLDKIILNIAEEICR